MIKLQTLAMAGSADQSAARPGSPGVLFYEMQWNAKCFIYLVAQPNNRFAVIAIMLPLLKFKVHTPNLNTPVHQHLQRKCCRLLRIPETHASTVMQDFVNCARRQQVALIPAL